jgi:hypothetical protein
MSNSKDMPQLVLRVVCAVVLLGVLLGWRQRRQQQREQQEQYTHKRRCIDATWREAEHSSSSDAPCNQVALVSTTRQSHALVTWVQYHLALGFARLYLFFDHPEGDASLVELQHWISTLATQDEKDRLVITLTSKVWFEQVQKPLLHKSQQDMLYYDTEVMTRQMLNAETALVWIKQCHPKHIQFLLHMDTDELWYPQRDVERIRTRTTPTKDMSVLRNVNWVNAYFARIPAHVQVIAFQNWEVIPTRMHSDNVFQDLHLFRRDQVAYRAYCGVKSAIRVNYHTQQYAHGVHYWRVDEGLQHLKPWPLLRGNASSLMHVKDESAVILHYVSPTFDQWLTKYQVLGTFPDTWFGGSIPIGIVYHKASRDQIIAATRPDGSLDLPRLQAWYNAHSLWKQDDANLQSMLKQHACMQVSPLHLMTHSDT